MESRGYRDRGIRLREVPARRMSEVASTVLLASSITYVEAVLGEHFTYAQAMGMLASTVLVGAAVVTWLGPEARGVSFRRATEPKDEC